jgi:6,7-dimethyl-8-ribityllumazine synthase
MTAIDQQPDLRIAIVAGRFNGHIVDRLLDGCTRTLAGRGVTAGQIEVIRVPGAFEIPVVVQALAARRRADAIIALGVVIRGETAHFELVAGECARKIADIAVAWQLPVIHGVLAVESAEQALDRSGADEGNKGSEAAAAALDMIAVLRGIDGR